MDELFAELGHKQKDLVHLLHRVQAEFGYIPPEAVARVAERLRITESEVVGVLTFYRAFRLKPRGRHVVTVCAGTSCHVRDGAEILREMERQLAIGPGETTSDRLFTLETVNCLGCCAIGPTVVVDGRYYSRVSIREVAFILEEYRGCK
jgi:NADH:ubiquinone oxidoreductase subunit E